MNSIIYILTVITLIVCTPQKSEPFDASYTFILTLVYVFIVSYFLYRQKKIHRNWVRFDVIFLIGYTIVHFQIPFLESIGVSPYNPEFIWINKEVVNYATWMSTLAITLWMWGYSIIQNRPTKSIKPATVKINYKMYDLVLLLVFAVFLSLTGRVLATGTYEGTGNWGEGAVYVYLVLQSLLYLRIIYFFSNFTKNTSIKLIVSNLLLNKIFFVIVVTFSFLFLMQGDRGPVLQISLVIIGSYVIFVKPVSLWKLSLFVVVGAFAFSLIGLGRGIDTHQFYDGNVFQRGMSSFKDNVDDTNITNELASSVRIQYMALDLVPNKHPHMYGLMFLIEGLSVFPFAASTFIELFDVSRMYSSSARFFTTIEMGAMSRHGVGTELLADIYINFGILGTFLLMFLFGVLVSYVYKNSLQKNFTYIIVYIALLYSSLYFNRSGLLTPVRDIAYMLFFNYIYTRLIRV